MTLLRIKREIDLPVFGTWEWAERDYAVPLIFPLDGVAAELRLNWIGSRSGRKRDVIFLGDFQLKFQNPSPEIVKSLGASGGEATKLAEKIHSFYSQVMDKFESILLAAAPVRSLMPATRISINDFFGNQACTWQITGGAETPFSPRIKKQRKGLNALFVRDQLITVEKWRRLQVVINEGDFPDPELLELLRIRARLKWKGQKIPTIEAAVFVESLLRSHAEKTLLSRGFSKNRFKALKDELTFNTFLNVLLPLSMSKSSAKRMEPNIRKVDALRKIRNDLVHGNIGEGEIDETKVREGIEGELVLLGKLKASK